MGSLNVHSRTIFCKDNLDVLRGINSDCIDLIYLDPPFNKNKEFTSPTGSSAKGAGFSDIFRREDIKDEWVKSIEQDNEALHALLTMTQNMEGAVKGSYNYCYLVYMAMRLVECHRILKDTGSLYLHCDPTMSHYLKLLLDCVFGESGFNNEIAWERIKGAGKRSQYEIKNFGMSMDALFFYSKTNAYLFNADAVSTPYPDIEKSFPYEDDKGRYKRRNPFRPPGLGARPNLCYEYKGITPPHESGWTVSKERLEQLDKDGELEWGKGKVWRKQRPASGIVPNNIWTDINPPGAAESVKYPTQKPLALLERIIEVSSRAGDVVLDPFCGCATTCVAAQKLGRKWIGVDVSRMAYDLVKERIDREVPEMLRRMEEREVSFEVEAPERTDIGHDYREKKWVYVVSKPGTEWYKVGVAKNWKSRLGSYQTSDPERSFKMDYKYLTPYFNEIEKHVHQTFAAKNEWVLAPLKKIIKTIEGYKHD